MSCSVLYPQEPEITREVVLSLQHFDTVISASLEGPGLLSFSRFRLKDFNTEDHCVRVLQDGGETVSQV